MSKRRYVNVDKASTPGGRVFIYVGRCFQWPNILESRRYKRIVKGKKKLQQVFSQTRTFAYVGSRLTCFLESFKWVHVWAHWWQVWANDWGTQVLESVIAVFSRECYCSVCRHLRVWLQIVLESVTAVYRYCRVWLQRVYVLETLTVVCTDTCECGCSVYRYCRMWLQYVQVLERRAVEM